MSRPTDDLTDLLRYRPDDGVSFRQATILTFDIFTGLNTVQVADTVLTDVPLLGNGGLVAYFPGDTVVLVRQGASWAILGRVSTPGSSPIAAVGRYYEATAAVASSLGSNFATTTSPVTQVSVNVTMPTWAETVTVSASLLIRAVNSTGSPDHLHGVIALQDGQFINWGSATVPSGSIGQVTVVHNTNIVVVGGATFLFEGQVYTTTAAWAAAVNNDAYLSIFLGINSNNGP